MTAIRYCANQCQRRDADQRIPVQLPDDTRALICRRCEQNLTKWLTDIPDHYALLNPYARPDTADTNPDSKATKRAEQPAPIRLDVVDLLDQRYGRRWLGTEITEDRRGALGDLLPHVRATIAGRDLKVAEPDTVTAACTFLRRHLLWIGEQEWVVDFTEELKQLHRAVSEAAGIYRRPPVGRCHVVSEAGKPCGGPLFASSYGGVACPKCGATWDANHLRQLGLAQAQSQQESA